MKKIFISILVCILVSASSASSQTRRRSSSKSSARATKAAAEKSLAEVKAGRDRLGAQIKNLSHFLYLLGGIVKGIESVDQAVRAREASTVVMEQNQRNKTKIRDSLKSLRDGLDRLEADFRFHPTLMKYYPNVAGVSRLGESAENQATANRFDEAGRSLLKVVGQLTDALASMH